MGLHRETISFFAFTVLGILYGVLFDFFRALRKVKKRRDIIVSLQDIVYFIIVGIVLILFMYIYMKESLRMYLIFSIILGLVIYISIVGNKIRDIFVKLVNGYNSIVSFIFLPFEVFRQIFSKQIIFFKNIANKCCKKILYMINYTIVFGVMEESYVRKSRSKI